MSPLVKSPNSNLMMSPHDSSIVNWHHEKPSVVRLNSLEQDSSKEIFLNLVERRSGHVESSAENN